MAENELPTELVRWMSRIETKLDGAISGQGDHELRLRVLEAKIAQYKGWLIGAAAAGGGGVLSGVAALLGG